MTVLQQEMHKEYGAGSIRVPATAMPLVLQTELRLGLGGSRCLVEIFLAAGARPRRRAARSESEQTLELNLERLSYLYLYLYLYLQIYLYVCIHFT